MELSTDKILEKVASLAASAVGKPTGRLLDIGSGTGALLARLRQALPAWEGYACDYTEELMALDGQRVDVANLSTQPLPYGDNSFGLVTCTEVVEHLENYRALVREIGRVLEPGGLVVLSTPNILNLQSRLRFLWFGFWNLFGPLPVGRSETFSTAGHITPVSFFYLAHALAESGLQLRAFEIDKVQRSAVPKLILLWPLIACFKAQALSRERRRYNTISPENLPLVELMNSNKMLLGRTIIVAAEKPLAR
jgi:ubiquinone/menaquinone biosynthesis C-methylase UbiE